MPEGVHLLSGVLVGTAALQSSRQDRLVTAVGPHNCGEPPRPLLILC